MLVTLALITAAFIIGAVTGAMNASTVTNSITVIKEAEQRAEATLAQILDHKAS